MRALITVTCLALASTAHATSEEEWGAKCFADYDDFRRLWAPIEEETRKAIAATEGEDFYTAFPKLRALFVGLRLQAKKVGFANGQSYAHAVTDGVAYEVLRAITRLAQRTGHTHGNLYDPAGFFFAHPETGRASFDRLHYCARAFGRGTHRTPPYDSVYVGVLRADFLPEGERAAFLAEDYKLDGEVVRDIQISDPYGPACDKVNGKVTSISTSRGTTTFVLALTGVDRNCRQTDRIARVTPGGYVEYEVSCYDGPAEYAGSVKVTHKGVAPEIRKGDEVRVAYLPGDERPKHVAAVSVEQVIRNGKEIGNWSFDAARFRPPSP